MKKDPTGWPSVDESVGDHEGRIRDLELRRSCCDPAATVGDYPLTILGLSDVRGYWRLGEGASPFADTSGYAPSNAADLTVNTGSIGSTPMTQNVTPGLLPTAQDDGAVGFNQEGTDAGAPVRPYLADPDNSSNVNFDFGSGHPTMSAIVRIKPSSTITGFWGGIIGCVHSSDSRGWAVQMRFPTGEIQFYRSATSGSSVTTTTPALATLGGTHTIAVTYDGTIQRVYVNGALVASVADATNIPTVTAGSPFALQIGGFDVNTAGGFWAPFYGVIDEAAVYGTVLTDAEVAALHAAAVGGVPDGWVPISDGAGHVFWGPPGSAPSGSAGGVLDGNYPNPGLAAAVAGAGLAETSDVLSVNVDSSTLEISADALRVKADGITANEIAANAVGASELAATTVAAGSYGDTTHVGTFTVDGDGRLTAASSVAITSTFDPASATTWWFPLADSDGTLVLDDTGSLIPTLIPL